MLRFLTYIFIVVAAWTNVAAGVQAQQTLEASVQDFRQGHWLEGLDRLLEYSDNGMPDATPEQKLQIYLFTGYIYAGFNDYVTAVNYYERALAMSNEYALTQYGLRAAANAEVTLCALRNRTRATQLLTYLRAGVKDSPTPYNRYLLLISEAAYERYFGSSDKAIAYLQKCLGMTQKGEVDSERSINALSELADIYVEHGNADSALYYIRQIENRNARVRQLHVEVENLRHYMRLYGQTGAQDSALYYERRYFAMRDSLLNTARFMQLSGKHNVDREERGRMRIQDLTDVVHHRTMALVLAVVVILVITALSVWLRLQKVRLNSAYKALWEKNRQLEAAGIPAAKPKEQPADSAPTEAEMALDAAIQRVMADTTEWTDPEFSLQRMADLTESNTKYVSALINERYGVNFRSFINDYRIREARRRITDPEVIGRQSLQSIGESVGFKSSAAFISAFRKQTGLTPSLYLKMWQDDKQSV